jgi:hypothetical protein
LKPVRSDCYGICAPMKPWSRSVKPVSMLRSRKPVPSQPKEAATGAADTKGKKAHPSKGTLFQRATTADPAHRNSKVERHNDQLGPQELTTPLSREREATISTPTPFSYSSDAVSRGPTLAMSTIGATQTAAATGGTWEEV